MSIYSIDPSGNISAEMVGALGTASPQLVDITRNYLASSEWARGTNDPVEAERRRAIARRADMQWKIAKGQATPEDLNYYGGALTPQEIAEFSGTPINQGYLASGAYQLAGGDVNAVADQYGILKQQEAKNNRSFFQKATKAAVPLAIGSIGSLLAGAAIAPQFTGSLVSSINPFSPTKLTSEALLSAPASSFGSSGGLSGILGGVNTSQLLSGAAKGALGGYLSGGDLQSALLGGVTGGVAGGYGTAIGRGLGLGELGAQTFGGALQGASGGLASGDLKGASIGALLGGGMDYIQGGGSIPGLGRVAGAPLSGGLQGPTQGEGILGALTRGIGATTGGNTMFGDNSNLLGGALRVGGALYGQRQQENVNEDIRRRLMQAQSAAQGQLAQAQGMFNPYSQAGTQAQNQLIQALQAGFTPQDLSQDQGYQFRLQEGQKALDRQMAASGLGQSGAALKASQEYGQGLAAQEYQDAYNRWLAQNSQLAGQAGLGLGAIGQQAGLQQGIAGLTSDMGGIEAQIMAANAANRQRSLSEILGGLGSIFGV